MSMTCGAAVAAYLPVRSLRQWTGEERETLSRLVSEKKPMALIALIMGRSEPAIMSMATKLGIVSRRKDSRSASQAAMRKCLGGCDLQFFSAGFHHRVCDHCRRSVDWRAA